MIYEDGVAWRGRLSPITFNYEFSRDHQLFENVWKKPQNEISPKLDWALTSTMHWCEEGNSVLKKGMLWYYLVQSLFLLLGQLKLAPIVRKSTLVLVFVHKCWFVYRRTHWSLWKRFDTIFGYDCLEDSLRGFYQINEKGLLVKESEWILTCNFKVAVEQILWDEFVVVGSQIKNLISLLIIFCK